MALPDTPEVREKLRKLKELELAERETLEVKEDQKIRKAVISFPDFCETVMRDERTDEPIKLAAIHRSWIDHITNCWANGLHSCILAPFGHGKTAIFGIALPLWLFGVDPTLRIKLFCANDKLARERLGLVRQYVEESDEYHEVFPNIRPHPSKPWAAHQLYLDRHTKAKDASLQAFGAMASAIGGRSDINLFDDLNDAKNTLVEPRRREQVNRNYRAVFMSRLDRISGHASMIACLTGDTPVLMADGTWQSIRDVQTGQLVCGVDMLGKVAPRRVLATLPQPECQTLAVRTSGHVLRCTPDHPLLVVASPRTKKAGWRWRRADQLKKGDLLVTLKEQPLPASAPLDLLGLWLLGYLFGDGWVTEQIRCGKQPGVRSYCVCVANSAYPKLDGVVRSSFKRCFGVPLKPSRFGYHRADSAPTARRLLQLGLRGRAKTKRLPAWLFRCAPHEKRIFLHGFLAADGHHPQERRAGVFQVHIANYALLEDIRRLALTCGVRGGTITSSTRMIKPPNSPKPIRATGHYLYLTFCQNRREGFSVALLPRYRDKWDAKTLRFVRVDKIERSILYEPVYDLSVEGSAYVANGLIVHNTRWHDQDAVGQILEDEDMRNNYGILIQRISEDFDGIDCEYLIGNKKSRVPRTNLEYLLREYRRGQFHVGEAESGSA